MGNGEMDTIFIFYAQMRAESLIANPSLNVGDRVGQWQQVEWAGG